MYLQTVDHFQQQNTIGNNNVRTTNKMKKTVFDYFNVVFYQELTIASLNNFYDVAVWNFKNP